MATRNENDPSGFREFLQGAPTLEEASSGATTELTGLVSRAAEGRFAITTGDGKTYELEIEAVRRFQRVEGQGLGRMATIEVASDVLKAAGMLQIKPIIKDLHKDPIKDIIHDGKHLPIDTLAVKDIQTDYVADHKHLHKDVIFDTVAAKDAQTDNISDNKYLIKDIHKDPLQDPVNTGYGDNQGTLAEGGNIPDPAGQVGNPGFAGQAGFQAQGMQANMMPFIMATPHQAPQHLLAMQGGMQPAAFGAGNAQLKQVQQDLTLKEVGWAETTHKELIRDTLKELVRDTSKEMIWDTYYEGGPYTLVEGGGGMTFAEGGGFDPGQVVTQPGNFGQPGFV